MSTKVANFALSMREGKTLNPLDLKPQMARHAMLSNLAVCTAFVNREPADNRNMRSTGNTLYSYETAIAQFTVVGGVLVLIINQTKYSPTTGRQREALYKAMKESGKKFVIMNTTSKVGYGVWDLIKYVSTEELGKVKRVA